MRSLSIGRMASRLLICLGLLYAALLPAFGQGTEDLLPVTEAYQLSADAGTPGVLKLHWKIAPDYYLYRGRMKFTAGDGVTLGKAQLPDGEKHHDEYLGDVETYHHNVEASIPYRAAAGATRLRLAVQYQGCRIAGRGIALDRQSIGEHAWRSPAARTGLPFCGAGTGPAPAAAALDHAQGLLPVSRPDHPASGRRPRARPETGMARRGDASRRILRRGHGVLG